MLLATVISQGSTEPSKVTSSSDVLSKIKDINTTEDTHFNAKFDWDLDTFNLSTIDMDKRIYKTKFISLNSKMVPPLSVNDSIIYGNVRLNNTILLRSWNFKNNTFTATKFDGIGSFNQLGIEKNSHVANYSLFNGTTNLTKFRSNVKTLKLVSANESYDNVGIGFLKILKFADDNHNAKHDPYETGINDINFVIINVSTYEEIETIATNKEGVIKIGLNPGRYLVCEVIYFGWENTTPLVQLATISSNNTTLLYFGNRARYSSPSGSLSTGGVSRSSPSQSSRYPSSSQPVTPSLPIHMENISSQQILQIAIDALWDAMPSGWILYNPSSNMTVGEKELVDVRIARNITDDLSRELRGRGEARLENISKIGTRMRVELHGDSFQISPLFAADALEQPIVGNYSQWEWEVMPLISGNQTLRLYVDAVWELQGYEDRYTHIQVFEKNINVKMNRRYEIIRFLENYWQYIITTIVGSAGVISLIILIVTYLSRRMKRKELEGSED